MSETNGAVIFTWKRVSDQVAGVTIRRGDDLLACEAFAVTKPKQRKEFVERLCGRHPDVDAAEVEQNLIRVAADMMSPEPDEPEGQAAPDANELLKEMPDHVVEEGRGNRAAKWRLSASASDGDGPAVLPAVEKVFPETTWKPGSNT